MTTSTSTPKLSLSIISHGQSAMIASLLSDLRQLALPTFEVLITVNTPEDETPFNDLPFPSHIIRNSTAKGFGANHNAAFAQSKGKFFVVLNPDIRISSLNFQTLIAPFKNKNIAAVAPVIRSNEGKIEDSARRFPTLFRFAKRVLFNQRNPDYKLERDPYSVDWVAGMFVVFKREAYESVNGFDDRRFFMYLEDADICRRLRKNDWGIFVNPAENVTHMAQRASRRNLKHMRWHAISAFRYLTGL